MATMIIKNFVSSKAVAHALYEFIIPDAMSKSTLITEAIASARFALNCQDPDIIIDPRKLNARVTNVLFDPFGVKIAVVVEGRVDDRWHGEMFHYCFVLLCLFYLWPRLLACCVVHGPSCTCR